MVGSETSTCRTVFELELDSVEVEYWICLKKGEYRECHPAPVLEDGDLEEGCEDYRFPRSR
jgi:hypothetical protein